MNKRNIQVTVWPSMQYVLRYSFYGYRNGYPTNHVSMYCYSFTKQVTCMTKAGHLSIRMYSLYFDFISIFDKKFMSAEFMFFFFLLSPPETDSSPLQILNDKCSEGCKTNNAVCDNTGQCVCKLGWYGDECNYSK